MSKLFLPFTPRFILLTIALSGTAVLGALAYANPGLIQYLALPLAISGSLALLGFRDLFQSKHAIHRTLSGSPVAGLIRGSLVAGSRTIRLLQ